jgi:translocator protein
LLIIVINYYENVIKINLIHTIIFIVYAYHVEGSKMVKKNISTLIIFLLIPIAIGLVSSLLAGNISEVYNEINQPALSPPSYVFPIVWTILYLLMGISSYLVYMSGSPDKEKALQIYTLQLLINFFWSPIFFGLKLYYMGFILLLLLIFVILVLIIKFYKIIPLAGILQIPYLLWCIFAAYLSFQIYYLNQYNF